MTPSSVPEVQLSTLDQLWFQAAGTFCNLTCRHCFISCSPHNDSFGFLSLETVRRYLDDSQALGVREYYFTGGEPFLNRQMTDILELTLEYGPATVLTNGTVLREEWLERLVRAESKSLYSLEFRVSLDGFTPETNDPIRGQGTFQRALSGVMKLVEHGFLPIITAARTWPLEKENETVEQFVGMLRSAGYDRPRLKILPTLQLGAEESRTRPYDADERITVEMLTGFDMSQLLCEHARVITDRGVHVCPILIDSPDSLLGNNLEESQRGFPLQHGACFTCYQHGAICSNPSSSVARSFDLLTLRKEIGAD